MAFSCLCLRSTRLSFRRVAAHVQNAGTQDAYVRPGRCAGHASRAASMTDHTRFATVADLKDFLGKAGIPVVQYGQGRAKGVEQLFEEVRKGETCFRMEGTKVIRCVRVVTVLITDSQGKVLHEMSQTFADGRVRERRMPLSEKLLPLESPLDAARRGICEELGTILRDPADIDLDTESLTVSTTHEESLSYPGLSTEYTLHQVRATIQGLPSGPFETREVHGDIGFEHLWDWLDMAENGV